MSGKWEEAAEVTVKEQLVREKKYQLSVVSRSQQKRAFPGGEHHEPPYMRGQVRLRLKTHHWISNVGSLGTDEHFGEVVGEKPDGSRESERRETLLSWGSS